MYSYSFISDNDNSSHNFSNIFSMESASGSNNNNNNNNLFQNIPSQLLRNNNNNSNNSGLYSTEENSRTQLFNLTQADSDES